ARAVVRPVGVGGERARLGHRLPRELPDRDDRGLHGDVLRRRRPLRGSLRARTPPVNAPAAPGGRRAALLAAFVYGALALGAQRDLVAGLRDHVYHQALPGNDCLLHAWTLAWDQHALATDPVDLADANIFYPYVHTLLYSDHLVGLAVLLAPLRLLTDNA